MAAATVIFGRGTSKTPNRVGFRINTFPQPSATINAAASMWWQHLRFSVGEEASAEQDH
jgi:hypothetical protein